MKIFEFIGTYKRDNIKTVICKSDGLVKYCNALSVNGACIVKDCICSLAVAAIVEKDGFTQYLAIEH